MEKHFYIVIVCALMSLHLLLVQGARQGQDIKCGGISTFFKHFIIYYAYIFIPGQALWVSCLAGQRNIRNVTHLHKCIFKLLINGCALWLKSTSELHHAHVFFPLACRALVDEMEWVISQIDPKKMIQTGSFRINPDGSQSVREVTYLSFIMT